jgi:nucleoside-triphosphatase THEP1
MRLAAVPYDNDGGARLDDVLAEAVRILKGGGVRLAGSIQRKEPAPNRTRCSIVLEDLASGRRILVSEDRGPHARGCRLNASALEEAAVLATSSIEDGAGLVIINRFAKQETEGRGFRQAIEAAVLRERPVLVGVSETNRASWEAFAGSESEYVPCSIDAVVTWCRGVAHDARAGV